MQALFYRCNSAIQLDNSYADCSSYRLKNQQKT